MVRFRPLVEGSGEAIDVLCCVILGLKVKDMMRVLKQPQSSISMKLDFLINKEGVVKKNKWQFEINWNPLLKMLRNAASLLLGSENKKYLELFDDKRLKRIMESYASTVVVQQTKPKRMLLQIRKPKGFYEILWSYLTGILLINDNELKKYDKRFIKLKRSFQGISDEKLLFLNSED